MFAILTVLLSFFIFYPNELVCYDKKECIEFSLILFFPMISINSILPLLMAITMVKNLNSN